MQYDQNTCDCANNENASPLGLRADDITIDKSAAWLLFSLYTACSRVLGRILMLLRYLGRCGWLPQSRAMSPDVIADASSILRTRDGLCRRCPGWRPGKIFRRERGLFYWPVRELFQSSARQLKSSQARLVMAQRGGVQQRSGLQSGSFSWVLGSWV